MQLVFYILITLNWSQSLLANSDPGLLGNLLKPILNPVQDLFKPTPGNTLTNLHTTLENNKANLLDGLFGNSETDVCGQQVDPPKKGLFGIIGTLIKGLTNIVGAVLNGLNKITSYLGVTIDIQNETFNSLYNQEQTQSANLQNYVNSQFTNIVNSAGETLDMDMYVDAVNTCMETLVKQASNSNGDNSQFKDCNVPIDDLINKLKQYQNSGLLGSITNIINILEDRRTTIGSILDARELIDSYTTDSFADTVHDFANNVEKCMKDKLPEADYFELVNLINSLESNLNLDGLDLQSRVDVINNVISTIQTWIDQKVNKS